MKKFNYLFSLFVTIILFASCEANKIISVTVIDKITQQPIDSVFIEIGAGKKGNYDKNYSEGYTNASRKFETRMMAGCAFGCYDISTKYSKPGHQSKIEINNTETIAELDR